MFRTMAHGSLLVAVLLASAVSAHAGAFDQVDVERWLGLPPGDVNEAVVVIDWKSQDPDKLFVKAFGYRWSKSEDKSGADILNELQTYYGDPGRFFRKWETPNTSIRAFGWDANEDGEVTKDPAGPDWYEEGFGDNPPPQPPGYWVHFASSDGMNWDLAPFTLPNPLEDGAWEGWSWDAVPPPGDDPPDTPVGPPTVPMIPEPATLVLLSLGLGALAYRKRHSFR